METKSKDSLICSLVRYAAEKNARAFEETVRDTAYLFHQEGKIELQEFLLAQIGVGPVMTPQEGLPAELPADAFQENKSHCENTTCVACGLCF